MNCVMGLAGGSALALTEKTARLPKEVWRQLPLRTLTWGKTNWWDCCISLTLSQMHPKFDLMRVCDVQVNKRVVKLQASKCYYETFFFSGALIGEAVNLRKYWDAPGKPGYKSFIGKRFLRIWIKKTQKTLWSILREGDVWWRQYCNCRLWT